MRIGCGNSLFFTFRQIVERLRGIVLRSSRNRSNLSSDVGLSIPFPPDPFDFNVFHWHPSGLNLCWGGGANCNEYFTVEEIRTDFSTPVAVSGDNSRALYNSANCNAYLLPNLFLGCHSFCRSSDWFAKLLCNLKISLSFHKSFIKQHRTSFVRNRTRTTRTRHACFVV